MENRKRTLSISSSEEEPSGKVTKGDDVDTSKHYSSIALKLMAQMGYRKGMGLGKDETGRVNIIEASNQRGRRGLGMTIDGLEATSDDTWVEDENVMIKQDPEWMFPYKGDIPPLDMLNKFTVLSERKEYIADEYEFCEKDILDGILKNKSIFDKLGNKEFLSARTRANPYETIRGAIFQNRAAMKMAEIDASFDFMFTSHDEYKNNSNKDLLYFADICAGPGGFSEYVLWRAKWHSKGFGFTLRADWANDFKIEDFIAGTPETFDCHYGVNGWEGDGDIFKEDNIKEFQKYIHENTNNKGVHFVMADGGFSVEGQENIQEILSKQLYLCQFLCALAILRKGGHFVCKVFDLFTPFSVGLVYLMNMAFEQTCIFKPVTSRPANSERYLVCKNLKQNTGSICEYMFELNRKINNCKNTSVDVQHVFPLDELKNDSDFYNYVITSNNGLGARQILGLRKLATYVRNTSLVGADQSEVRKQCLKIWQVPLDARCAVPRNNPEKSFQQLMKSDYLWMSNKINSLTEDTLKSMKSALDFKFQLFGDKHLYLFSLGRSAVFQWDPTESKSPSWKRVSNSMKLELPRFTLIVGEFVNEYVGESRGQRKNLALHIFDAVYLGGEFVGNKGIDERIQDIQLFSKALSKPCRKDLTQIRAKSLHCLAKAADVFNNLQIRSMKRGMHEEEAFIFPDEKYFIPNGLYIMPCIKHPWHIHWSRSQNRLYYFNEKTGKSVFEFPKEAVADEKYTFKNKTICNWEISSDVTVSKELLLSYIAKK